MEKRIYKIQLGSDLPAIEPVNIFFLPIGNKLVMIDSGDRMDSSIKKLSDELKKIGFKLEDISIIINTHEHIEHFGGNAVIKDISGAKILAHRLAVPLIEDMKNLAVPLIEDMKNLAVPLIEDMKNQLPPDSELKDLPEDIALYIKGRSIMYNNLRTTNVDFILDDNKSIPIGDYSLRIIYTSGHTKGHICIYEEEEKYYLPVIW